MFPYSAAAVCLFWGSAVVNLPSTDSLRAKKSLLRGSVIYSESCGVRDRLLLFSLAHPLSNTRVCLSQRRACISRARPCCEVMTMESEGAAERDLAGCLIFPSCPTVIGHLRGCWFESVIKIQLRQPHPMAHRGENK